MNDLLYACEFFLIFALALIVYGAILAKTGSIDLMPYRAVHSIGSPEDVKRVGRIVIVVGLVIGAVSLLGVLFSG